MTREWISVIVRKYHWAPGGQIIIGFKHFNLSSIFDPEVSESSSAQTKCLHSVEWDNLLWWFLSSSCVNGIEVQHMQKHIRVRKSKKYVFLVWD